LRLIGQRSDYSSAWAALAAGLQLAAADGTPDPKVWATGCWEEARGVQHVDGLQEKLQLAVRHGASEFFVPASQFEQAQSVARAYGNLSIQQLRAGTNSPHDALHRLLQRLRARPNPPANQHDQAGLKACVDYYHSQPLDDPRTRAFYQSHLFPSVLARLRDQLQGQWPDWNPTHLATIVSRRPELVLLAALALRVRHVLLLYTNVPSENDQTQDMQYVRHRLEEEGVQCTAVAFRDDDDLPVVLGKHLARFLDGVPATCAAVDTTPGTKLMSLSLALTAPAGSWLLYLQHQTLAAGDHRPIPGTERYLRWQAGAKGAR
jgi:hypothetical protein